MARRDALLRLKKNLLARRSELMKRMGGDLNSLGTVHSGGDDPADVAFDASADEVTSSLVELEGRELNQIERALHQLKLGTYGICEGCSCKIPVARLNALPYSTMCIECQRKAEDDEDWSPRSTSLGWGAVQDQRNEKEVNLRDIDVSQN